MFAAFLCLSLLPLHAQENDFATWANVGFEYKVKPAFALSGALEWRTEDDLSSTDRWAMKMGGAYTLLPFLKLGASYEVHYSNQEDAGWKFRHRYRIEGTLSTRVQRIKLSLRERLQHTFDGTKDEFRLNSQLKLAYVLPKCKPEPYISIEMYNSLDARDCFDVKRMRYRAGIELPLSDRWEADLFYCRQWEQAKQKNVIGLTCLYSF